MSNNFSHSFSFSLLSNSNCQIVKFKLNLHDFTVLMEYECSQTIPFFLAKNHGIPRYTLGNKFVDNPSFNLFHLSAQGKHGIHQTTSLQTTLNYFSHYLNLIRAGFPLQTTLISFQNSIPYDFFRFFFVSKNFFPVVINVLLHPVIIYV